MMNGFMYVKDSEALKHLIPNSTSDFRPIIISFTPSLLVIPGGVVVILLLYRPRDVLKADIDDTGFL